MSVYVARMGDIGEPVRRIEFEPMPEEAPVTEPAAPAPAVEPEPVHSRRAA